KSTASRVSLTCEYKYSVGGKEYTNSRIASYPLSRSDIYKIGPDAKEGFTHKVYYDPANPKNAVLLKGWRCWALLIGLVFFAGTLAIIIALWKNLTNISELWKSWDWFRLPQ